MTPRSFEINCRCPSTYSSPPMTIKAQAHPIRVRLLIQRSTRGQEIQRRHSFIFSQGNFYYSPTWDDHFCFPLHTFYKFTWIQCIYGTKTAKGHDLIQLRRWTRVMSMSSEARSPNEGRILFNILAEEGNGIVRPELLYNTQHRATCSVLSHPIDRWFTYVMFVVACN